MRWHEILNELTANLDKFAGTITPTRGDQFDRMHTGGGGGQVPPKPPKRRDDRPERPGKKFIIAAEVHDDDWLHQVHFEALDWFEQATEEELKALIDCGFRGDYASDWVAEWTADHNTEVQAIMDWIQEEGSGFEVSVNEDDAMVWLAHYRPHMVDPHWEEHMGIKGSHADIARLLNADSPEELKKIWEQGFKAAQNPQRRGRTQDNPYPNNSKQWDAFNKGWIMGDQSRSA